MTTMILEMFSLLYAWLILHLIAKSSTSVLVTKTMIAICGEEDECKVISSSC